MTVFFLNIITFGEHLMLSVRIFHSADAAVFISIKRLPKCTVLLLFGTGDVGLHV